MMGGMDGDSGRQVFAQRYIDGLGRVLRDLPLEDLASAMEVLERALAERRQVFLAGNGGSAATASHVATDLVKGVAEAGGQGIRAIALSDNVPLLTAIANDTSYREIFAKQLAALGQRGDVLCVFSGSGNSENIARAVEVAQRMQMTTIAFLGMGGGKVTAMADVSVIVRSDLYGPIEDAHMVLAHVVTAYLRQWVAPVRQDRS